MSLCHTLGQGGQLAAIDWEVVETTENTVTLRVTGVGDPALLCGCADFASHSCACKHFFFFPDCPDCKAGLPGKHLATCPLFEREE